MTPTVAIAVAILAPLLLVPVLMLLHAKPNLREGATLATAVVTFLSVATLFDDVAAGARPAVVVGEMLIGLPMAFEVEPLGMVFAGIASFLWIVTTIYAIGYMRGHHERNQTRFYICFAVAISSAIGIAFAANMLSLFIFYEVLTLSTFPLVTHHQDKEARRGGRTYLAYLLGTSVGFVLPALVYCYIKTDGNLDFSPDGALSGLLSGKEAMVLMLLLVFGFAKGGLMPFHSWLPGAMVAPTPVSALLHAVAVVKVGVFCILRVITGVLGVETLRAFDLGTVIVWIAGFTVIVSSLIALSQDNLKRRLAFSTIGQLAYIILGASLLAPKGLTGSLMHIAMHAFGKITLFFCAGAIFVANGRKYISQCKGLAREMPFTMTAFAIGALSVVGIPPAGGFVSKLYLVWGTMEADMYQATCFYLVSSFLNACYFFPIIFAAFFQKPENPANGIRESHPCCVAALCITASFTLLLFFHPGPFYWLANMMSQVVF